MKWWFSDYDGTINLNNSNRIDKKDINFIKKWISEGNSFIVATGRMHHEITPILNQNDIPYNYMICNNGALVYDANKNVVSEVVIPLKARAQILEVLQKNKGIASTAYCLKDSRRIYSPVSTSSKEEVIAYLRTKGVWIEESKNPDNEILNDLTLNTIYFFADAEKIEELRKVFGKIDGCKLVRTSPRVLELMNKNVSKGSAVEQIQKIYSFHDKDIIASGDGENDIEMLRKARHAFAMENHQENVDIHADYIIKAVHEIEKYLL